MSEPGAAARRGREGWTLPDENAAKKGIALAGTNAIRFYVFRTFLVAGLENVRIQSGGGRGRDENAATKAITFDVTNAFVY